MKTHWPGNELRPIGPESNILFHCAITSLEFMGDHGHRQHPIRQTLVGRIEEKLPLFSMLVPKVLLNEDSQILETLKSNTQSNIQ